MQGWQIFLHSVRQVFGNFSAAVRISGLLSVLQIALVFVLGVQVIYSPDGGQAMMVAGDYPWGRVALYLLLSTIAGLWIAVAWHRYVLREEDSGSVIPAWHGDRIWAYFAKGFLIGLAVVAVTFVTALIIGLVASAIFAGGQMAQGSTPLSAIIVGLLMAWPAIYVFYRLSPALPAAALGEPLGLRDTWRKMAGKGGTIFMLALISIVASIVVGSAPIYLLGLVGMPAFIWVVIVQWVSVMVGISVMTTLYGHYVEGRALM
jgi:hypothetical protein